MSLQKQKKNNIDFSINLKNINNQDITKQIEFLNSTPDTEVQSPINKNKKIINYTTTNGTNETIVKFKRFDRLGNEICKNGKQKVTFIDKVTNNSFKKYINIESFKNYNKIEDENIVQHNGCCLIE